MSLDAVVAGLGLILLLIGTVSTLHAVGTRERRQALARTESTPTATVRALADAAATAAGSGYFETDVEVTGLAGPGEAGVLVSPVSGTSCVWHRRRITQHYVTWYRHGWQLRTRHRTRVSLDETSRHPFVVVDADGELAVTPPGEIESPDAAHVERRDVSAGGAGVDRRPSAGDTRTTGEVVEEWVLLAGTRVLVSGIASDRSGSLLVSASHDRDLLVSTRTETELVAVLLSDQRLATVAGAALLTGGVALLVLATLLFLAG